MQHLEQVQTDLFNMPESVQESYGIKSSKMVELAKGKGCRCPLCHQFVKVYSRKITGSMCVALIKIWQAYVRYGWTVGDDSHSIHLEGLLKRCNVSSAVRGDAPKLQHWDFIRKIEGKRKDGSSLNGHYMLTKAGHAFMFCNVARHERAILYNNKFYGHEGKLVTILDCLGKKFSYDELMKEGINA